MKYIGQLFANPPTPKHKPTNEDKFTNNFFLYYCKCFFKIKAPIRIDLDKSSNCPTAAIANGTGCNFGKTSFEGLQRGAKVKSQQKFGSEE